MTLIDRVSELIQRQPGIGRYKIARTLGISEKQARTVLSKIRGTKGGSTVTQERDSFSIEESDQTCVATSLNRNIRTLDDLLKFAKVDLSIWEVERHVINRWETVMREPATTVGGAGDNAVISIGKHGEKSTLWTRESNKPLHEPLFQVKVWLRRKTPTAVNASLENLLKRIQELSRPAKLLKKPTGASRFMLEVSLFDAHFGLLAWNRETGDNYDLSIAESIYAEAMEDLLVKTQGCKPEKITLPIGNDFFHVNNPEGLTPTAHNVLDVDGRLPKVVETGERALIRAVNRCLQVAPVHIIWIPGNHDPQTSYFLCRTLKAYFHANPNVFVDVEPPTRKYIHFGINLIGYTHGNEEKHADLPTIMAGEQRNIWGTVKHCEWHVGHYHKKKETRYSAGDTFGGVPVKVLPSISGTDAWHFKKGYVKGQRMAEASLFDFHRGLVATYFSENLRNK